MAAKVLCDGAGCLRRAKGIPGLYQGFSMGLGSSIAGAGVGFATYEALTVAYRKRVGYAPTPAERGAIAGVIIHGFQHKSTSSSDLSTGLDTELLTLGWQVNRSVNVTGLV